MNPSEELDLLFAGWLANTLTDADRRRLVDRLADPAAAQRWRALADLEGALAEQGAAAAMAATKPSSARPARRRPPQRARTQPWAGLVARGLIAAALIAGVGWFAWPVTAVDHRDLPTTAGKRLEAGTALTVATDETIVLRWDDGTAVELVGPASTTVGDGLGKSLHLERGQLAADVQPQPATLPFVVRTPATTATVVGTRFVLRSDGAATSLVVEEGRVRLSSADGAHDVAAGDSAVAGRARAPRAGLVAWWPLDDRTGSQARDASGNGHHGDLRSGAGWATDGSRPVLRLGGGDAHVFIPATGALAGIQAGSYTITARVRLAALPRGSIDESEEYAVVAGRQGWTLGLHIEPDGAILMQHFDRAEQPLGFVTPAVVRPGRWFHLTGIVDRPARTTRVAIDGRIIGQDSWPENREARVYTPDEPWHLGIGSPEGLSRWPLHGDLADVRVYDRALTALDIAEVAADGQITE